MSQQNQQQNTSADEAFYNQLFKTFDIQNSGRIQAGKIFGFALSSGLNKAALGDIWDEATKKQSGGLNLPKFIDFMRLISLAQKGIKPTLQNITSNLPLLVPKMQYPLHLQIPKMNPDPFGGPEPDPFGGLLKPSGPTWDTDLTGAAGNMGGNPYQMGGNPYISQQQNNMDIGFGMDAFAAAAAELNHSAFNVGTSPKPSGPVWDTDVTVTNTNDDEKEKSVLRIENKKLKTAINQWKELVQDKDEEIEQMEEEIDSLRLENGKLENTVRTDKRTIDDLQFKFERSQSLVNDLLNIQKEKTSSEDNGQNNLQQLNKEQARMIEQYKMNTERFKETVQKLRTESDAWKLEKQQLMNQQRKMKQSDGKNAQLLRQYKAENESLRQQNNTLNDECKEAKMENIELKQKLQRLKQKRNIDPSQFMEWSGDEFVEWICSLEKGKFEQYRSILSAAFKKQGISGQAIPHIQKNDWQNWGIQNFMDRTKIDQYVQKLIPQNVKNIKYDNPFEVPVVNDDEGAPTAYIQH